MKTINPVHETIQPLRVPGAWERYNPGPIEPSGTPRGAGASTSQLWGEGPGSPPGGDL